MPNIVTLPNGNEVEFPDGMDQSAMDQAIRQSFPDLGEASPQPTAPPPPAQKSLIPEAVLPQQRLPVADPIQLPELVPWQLQAASKLGVPGAKTAEDVTGALARPSKRMLESFVTPEGGAVLAAQLTPAAPVVNTILAYKMFMALPNTVTEAMKDFKQGNTVKGIEGMSEAGMEAVTMGLGGLSGLHGAAKLAQRVGLIPPPRGGGVVPYPPEASGPLPPVITPEGEPNARSQQEATEVHGDLRTQPEPSPGQVPVQEGGQGVQPQTEGRVQETPQAQPDVRVAPISFTSAIRTKDGNVILAASHRRIQQEGEMGYASHDPLLTPKDPINLNSEEAKAKGVNFVTIQEVSSVGHDIREALRRKAAGEPFPKPEEIRKTLAERATAEQREVMEAPTVESLYGFEIVRLADGTYAVRDAQTKEFHWRGGTLVGNRNTITSLASLLGDIDEGVTADLRAQAENRPASDAPEQATQAEPPSEAKAGSAESAPGVTAPGAEPQAISEATEEPTKSQPGDSTRQNPSSQQGMFNRGEARGVEAPPSRPSVEDIRNQREFEKRRMRASVQWKTLRDDFAKSIADHDKRPGRTTQVSPEALNELADSAYRNTVRSAQAGTINAGVVAGGGGQGHVMDFDRLHLIRRPYGYGAGPRPLGMRPDPKEAMGRESAPSTPDVPDIRNQRALELRQSRRSVQWLQAARDLLLEERKVRGLTGDRPLQLTESEAQDLVMQADMKYLQAIERTAQERARGGVNAGQVGSMGGPFQSVINLQRLTTRDKPTLPPKIPRPTPRRAVDRPPGRYDPATDTYSFDEPSGPQALGIIPYSKGAALVGKAIGRVLKEIRDAPKFTPFLKAIGRWSGENQKTSLEIRALQKKIRAVATTDAREVAITNYLQAGGDMTKLRAWETGTSDPKLKQGYHDAQTLTPQEVAMAQTIRQVYDDYLARAQAEGLVRDGLNDYATQVWKRPMLKGRFTQYARFRAKLSNNFQFGQQRTFENFFEGEQAGFTPATKNISDLLGLYVSEMGKTIATRHFIKDLTSLNASDGRPLAAPSGGASVVTDPTEKATILVRPTGQPEEYSDYNTKWSHPALRAWKWVARDPESGNNVLFRGTLALHPEIAHHVRNMLSQSAIREWYNEPSAFGIGALPKLMAKTVDQWGSTTKQLMLGFLAPFHHAQEGTHAIGHRVDPVSIPKLDPADPALIRAMEHGLKLAGDSAAMEHFQEGFGGAREIFKKIPIVGEWANNWSDFLFNEYIPRLKYKTYQHILGRNSERYAGEMASGEVTLDDVEHLSGLQTNAAFGHLSYEMIGRNPTIQHLARIFLLAPDFLEARTRFAGQAAAGLIGKAGREQFAALATLAGFFYVGARILNKLVDDDYHWEEPFGLISNGRVYTMRSVPEDIWRAFKDSRRFIYGRISPVMGRGVVELLTAKNYRGEPVTAEDTIQDIMFSFVPITLRSLPGFDKLSPSQVNRTVLAYEAFLGAMGLQISRHSPLTKARKLGADYMRAQGIKEDLSAFPGKYQQLRYQLEDADIERAGKEIRRLVSEDKMKIGAIRNGFQKSLFRPWTKNEAMDRQFRARLSESDREIIKAAEAQRQRVWTRFSQAMRQAQLPE